MSQLAAKLAAAKKAVPSIAASASTAAATATTTAVTGADSDVIAFDGGGGQLKSFGDVKASDETSAFKGTGSLLEAAAGESAERLLLARPGTPPPKIDAHTGEEDEKTAFQARSTLFVLDQNEWRERGGGYLKVNLQKGGRARLLQRQEGSLKVILNAALQYKMPYAAVGDRAVRFIVCDTSTTSDDHRSQSWLARFARSDEADAFLAALKMALVTVPQPTAADAATTTATATARKKRALDDGVADADADAAAATAAAADDEQARAKKAATETVVKEKEQA